MNKPQIKTLRVLLAAGDTTKTATINLPNGVDIYAGAIVKNDQGKMIRLGLEENGQKIHEQLAADWWDGQLGSFQQRALLLNYEGGTTLTATVTTANPLAEAVEVEFAFQIWQKPVYEQNDNGDLVPGSC